MNGFLDELKNFFSRYWIDYNVLFLGFIFVFVGAGIVFWDDPGLRQDEKAHVPRVNEIYSSKETTLFPNITNIQGYHYTVAYIARGFDSIVSIGEKVKKRHVRAIHTIFFGSLLTVALYSIIRVLKLRKELLLATLFVPIVFPFVFLGYTDIPALITLLFAFVFFFRKQHVLAGASMAVCILFRQDSVIWVGALMAISLLDLTHSYGGFVKAMQKSKYFLLDFLKDNIAYLMVLIGFATFLILNDGVAVGDKVSHPAFHISLGNVYFFFVTIFISLLPILVGGAKRTFEFISKFWKKVLIGIALGLVFFNWTFVVDHPYNRVTPGFIHNDIPLLMESNTSAFLIGYIIMVYTLLFLWASLPLLTIQKRDFLILAVFSTLFLVLHWMIEPRYSIVPLVLVLLSFSFSRRLLYWQIAYGFILAICIMHFIILQQTVFL